MPRRCCVPNCTSNNSVNTSKGQYVTTFLLPTEEDKLGLWLKLINANCNSNLSAIPKCSGICVKHFEDKYVVTETSVANDDGTVSNVPLKKPRLELNAVPTIFMQERDTVLAKPARRRYIEDEIRRNEQKQAEVEAPEKQLPQVLQEIKNPFRPRTVPSFTVSGTYIIKAEAIKPGPRLLFDECISRVESEKRYRADGENGAVDPDVKGQSE